MTLNASDWLRLISSHHCHWAGSIISHPSAVITGATKGRDRERWRRDGNEAETKVVGRRKCRGLERERDVCAGESDSMGGLLAKSFHGHRTGVCGEGVFRASQESSSTPREAERPGKATRSPLTALFTRVNERLMMEPVAQPHQQHPPHTPQPPPA